MEANAEIGAQDAAKHSIGTEGLSDDRSGKQDAVRDGRHTVGRKHDGLAPDSAGNVQRTRLCAGDVDHLAAAGVIAMEMRVQGA